MLNTEEVVGLPSKLKLPGTPSDRLPAVIATGKTDVRRIFVSMAAREPQGRDADYLQWHALDHRAEQYRIAGMRHSLRLLLTPECRAARAFCDARYDAVAHIMTYFFAGGAAFDQFSALSVALGGERRPFTLPSIETGYWRVAGMAASPQAIAGADVIPWRPARGVYLIAEEGSASPAALAQIDGVAGVWWHQGGVPPVPGFRDNTGLQLTYCFLDSDPLQVAQRFREPLERRWKTAGVKPLLAAPFRIPLAFEWDRYLP
jgi:hypothetical protein